MGSSTSFRDAWTTRSVTVGIPELAELSAFLRDHHLPHRHRPELAGLQQAPDLLQERPGPDPVLDAGHRGRVDPGRPFPVVPGHAEPCLGQEIGVIDEVEQVTEPAGGIFSRPAVQLGLHLPYLAYPRLPRAARPARRRDSPARLRALQLLPDWHTAALPRDRLSRPRSTTAAPPRPRLRLASRLSAARPWQGRHPGTAAGGSHVHCRPVSGLGTRLYPCGIATATPQPFTVASHPRLPRPGQEFPAARQGGTGYAPPPSPHPPGLSWFCMKRRNSTGSSRIPSRLAHRARPIRQYRADATLSGLLPPSPPTRGSGCLQLHPAAATAGRRRSFTSIRKTENSSLVAHWKKQKMSRCFASAPPGSTSASRWSASRSGFRATPRAGAAAGDPRVRHHAPPAAGDGGLAALLGRGTGRDGGHVGLLEAGVLPAGAAGPGSPALPGVAGQGAARATEDRQAGLGLAGEGHRAGVASRVVRAARRHQAAAHRYPLPAEADPGPHRGEAAGREAAGSTPT